MAYADQRFRHDLRNTLNSLSLAMRAYEISDNIERVELLDMVIQSTDDAIAVLDNNPPEEDSQPPSKT